MVTIRLVVTDMNHILIAQEIAQETVEQELRWVYEEKIKPTVGAVEFSSVEQILAVGDGSNDLLMLKSAVAGIAYYAKDNVKQNIKYPINQGGLDERLKWIDNNVK